MKDRFLFRSSCLFLLLALILPRGASAFLIDEWERLEVIGAPEKKKVDPLPGQHWTDPLTGIRFLWIPEGCFSMGTPPRMEGREQDEGPVHPVCLSGFWLSQKEITQGEWRAIMRINPSHFKQEDEHPVERITWNEVEAMTSDLNRRFEGKVHFRLPTEAEWEYACREGGQPLVYSGRFAPWQLGWFDKNSLQTTHPAATRSPNGLGFFDMSGNVWEWTFDHYQSNAYENHEKNDPAISVSSDFRVIRGGGWRDGMEAMRCNNRGFARYSARRSDLGFRLAAVLDFPEPPEPFLTPATIPF